MARSSIVSELGFIVSFVRVRAIYCFLNQFCETFLELPRSSRSKAHLLLTVNIVDEDDEADTTKSSYEEIPLGDINL